MSANRKRSWVRRIVGAVAVLVVLAVGGPFVYFNLIEGKAPAKLSLSSVAISTRQSAGTNAPFAGTWKISVGSIAGYRVKETLFGQSNTAAGRTNNVTGSITIRGTTVTKATFSVDMKRVKSDNGIRDSQFQGRIMDTSAYPTATFTLTAPIDLAPLPKDGITKPYTAAGKLTLHGTTKPVTIALTTRRTGRVIQVQGSLPIRFSDYKINNPSGGPASVGNAGTMEFLLQMQPT